MAFLSTKTGQFTYFAMQLGERDWRGKHVLDFGCNIGNMLRDPSATIDEERYWCIDVVEQSVEEGKRAFPKAHWIYYDRYSFFFNPYGRREVKLPALSQKFDYIVAYSVFTNTSRTDMFDLVAQLKGCLSDGGALAFTFIDPHYRSWRERHMSELDRDYDDYRSERQSAFENDFGSWRERRMQKRGLLGQVREHMEVVGNDEQHVGTVDKTAGDRIILTKSDPESGGAHHSLSCSDVDRVEGDRVILDCSADQARKRWRDESRSRALFERHDQGEMGPRILDRSFEGTYR